MHNATIKHKVKPGIAISQSFEKNNGLVRRIIKICNEYHIAEISHKGVGNLQPSTAWHVGYLRGYPISCKNEPVGEVRVLDLFSGGGGLAQGVAEAAQSLGIKPIFVGAVDTDELALEVHQKNFNTRHLFNLSADELVDYQLWKKGQNVEFADTPELFSGLERLAGKVDLVIGGPPCQGHSNLNNHTRRNDARNRLYLTVPAIASALGAKAAIIENVITVVRDKHNVVEISKSLFRSAGFHVGDDQCTTLKAENYGVPQMRRRHFLVVGKGFDIPLVQTAEKLKSDPVTIKQAINDTRSLNGSDVFNSHALLSEKNQVRINFLHDNDLFELPNYQRPDCHKDGHTYPSVYGRLNGDNVSNTITTGFMSPGRGRYIHYEERRGLTPHEAARLQGFPDTFKFEIGSGRQLGNSAFSKLIGDAVPPALGFVAGVASLSSLIASNPHE